MVAAMSVPATQGAPGRGPSSPAEASGPVAFSSVEGVAAVEGVSSTFPALAAPSPTASPTASVPAATPIPTTIQVPGSASACILVCAEVPTPVPEPIPDPVAAASFKLHVPILEYHRIKPWEGETGVARDLITPPDVFAAQMDAMAAAGWKTITMAELGDDLRFGIAPPPKTFMITFDDGYKDGYQNAFPILLAHEYVATYFVIAGRIGSGSFLDAFELRQLAAAGNEIGNHSYSHGDLEAMAPAQQLDETDGASAIIANITGVWPESFAYPKGLGSGVLTARLAACPGLTTAVVEGGSAPETWNNRWQLPRIRVGAGTDPTYLVARVSRYR